PYDAALNPAATFSVEAWAYVTGSATDWRSIVTSRDPSNGYMLYAGLGGTWEFWTGVSMAKLVGPTPIANDNWTYLVGTYDGTHATLYVNGAPDGSPAVLPYTPNSGAPLRIGAGQTESIPGFQFFGRIDEVAIY